MVFCKHLGCSFYLLIFKTKINISTFLDVAGSFSCEHHFDCEEWRGLSVARVDRPMQPSLQQSWRVANRMTLLLTLPHNPKHPKQNNRFVLPPIYWLAGWHNSLSSSNRSEQPPLNPQTFAPQESKNARHLRRDYGQIPLSYGHFKVNMMINWWIWLKKTWEKWEKTWKSTGSTLKIGWVNGLPQQNWMTDPRFKGQTLICNDLHLMSSGLQDAEAPSQLLSSVLRGGVLYRCEELGLPKKCVEKMYII